MMFAGTENLEAERAGMSGDVCYWEQDCLPGPALLTSRALEFISIRKSAGNMLL